MKKLIVLLAVFFLSGYHMLFAQSFNTDNTTFLSPTATNIGLFGNIPVSLANGTTNISIPIYEVKDGPIKIPITLNYHSSGFRPDVHPGIVGSNWALSAGGMITRIIKGVPDDYISRTITFNPVNLGIDSIAELAPGIIYNTGLLNNWTDPNHIKAIAKNGIGVQTLSNFTAYDEAEPDEYDFNFNGYSGKFVFDATTGKMKVLSDPSIKVECDYTNFEIDSAYHYNLRDTLVNYNILTYDDGVPNDAFPYAYEKGNTEFPTPYQIFEKKLKGFKITTPDGFVYKFGFYGVPYSSLERQNKPLDSSTDFFAQVYEYLSIDSWYLTEVDSPDQKNKVTFEYGDISNVYSPILSFTKLQSVDNMNIQINSSQSSSTKLITDEYHGKFIFPAYLTKITTTNEELDFKYSKTQELWYDTVGVATSLTNQIQSTDVSYLSYYNFRNLINSIDYSNCDPHLRFCEPVTFGRLHWLELDSIAIRNKRTNTTSIKWNFQFSHDNSKRLTLNSAAKSDSTGANPQTYSFHYNSSQTLPPYCSYETDHWGFYNNKYFNKSPANYTSTDMANYYTYKQTDTAYLKTGMLDKITYPTGGYTMFQYEPHQYTQKVLRDASSGDFSLSPTFSPTFAGGLRIKQMDNYSAGNQLLSSKKYEYTGGILSGDVQYYVTGQTGTIVWNDLSEGTYTNDHFLSQTILPVSTNTTGSHIGYSKVTEIEQGNGYTEYYYTNYDILDDNFITSVGAQKSLYYPFASRENERGVLKQKIIYNEAGTPLRSETYTYPANPDTANYIRAIYTNQTPITASGYVGARIEGAAYKIYNYPYKAVQYASVDNPTTAQAITETHTYTYEPNYNFLQEDRMTNSKGEQVATQYHYPSDLISSTSGDSGPLAGLINANILNQPVETLNILTKNNVDYVKSAKIVPYTSVTRSTDALAYISDFVAPKSQYILNATVPLTLTNVSGAGTADPDGDGTIAYYNPGSTSYALAKAYALGIDGEQMAIDSHMQLQTTYDYDMHGNLSQIMTPGYNNKVQRKSYIWGYQDCYPIAQVNNATPIVASTGYGEALYEPFEVKGDGTLWGTALYDHTKYHTGSFSAKLPNTTSGEVSASRAIVHLTGEITKLKLSGWIFSDGPAAAIGINFTDYSSVSHIEKATTSATGNWTYVEKDIDVPSSYANYSLTLLNEGSGNVWYDDIRVVPSNASMTTYTYEPGFGMTSTTDARGNTTYYEYDKLQRLINVRDQNGNIKTHYCYNYAGQSVDCKVIAAASPAN